jgi:hypothetical protein
VPRAGLITSAAEAAHPQRVPNCDFRAGLDKRRVADVGCDRDCRVTGQGDQVSEEPGGMRPCGGV